MFQNYKQPQYLITQITNSIMEPSEFLGHGHFRWDNKAHVLDAQELKHLKEYFQL